MRTDTKLVLPGSNADAAKRPLQETRVTVDIVDLVATVELEHAFRNGGESPIEALLTFPMPPDAAFLGLQAEIGGETLDARVIGKRAAESEYDEAVADGHSAVMLSHPEPGILTLSLGNLMPSEGATIRLRFATRIPVAEARAWFRLPTVLRPRYGHWLLNDFETPGHDVAVEHPMSATIRVAGLLARSAISCPSHSMGFYTTPDATTIRIPAAYLDRDIVLGFDLKEAPTPVLQLVRHGDQVLATIAGALPVSTEPVAPMDLCLVLDGSGSMSGDAMMQSRAAVRSIAQLVSDEDRIQVIRFGSTAHGMFRRLMPCKAPVRKALVELADTLEANLGGTEMQAALLDALQDLQSGGDGRTKAILLVTDGAVQPEDLEIARDALVNAGIRVFVVAVGSSAGVEVLQPLAHATGAVIERAILGESIDAAAARMTRRARSPRAAAVAVSWPNGKARVLPAAPVYPGDALAISVMAEAMPEGPVMVTAGDARFTVVATPLPGSDALRSIIGQARHDAADASDRATIALEHGLLTKETSAILVRRRAEAERAESLPAVVKIPAMVPAGMLALPTHSRAARGTHFAKSMPFPAPSSGGFPDAVDASYLDTPAFLRRQSDPAAFADATALLAALAPYLRGMLASLASQGPTLESFLANLPEAMSGQARKYFESLGLDLGDPAMLVGLISAVLSQAATELTDEEEVMLSLAMASAGYPSVRLKGI